MNKNKQNQYLTLAVTLAFASCAAHTGPPLIDEAAASKAAQNRAAHATSLALKHFPSNAVWRLDEERGHVVLLDVWASWCDPCRDSLPLYDDLQREFAARGLKVYAINVDADSKVIAGFMSDLKVTLPVLLDPEAATVESTLKVKMMPTSFLIDKAGVIRHTHEGFDESLLSTYLEEINALLNEPDPEAR